MFLPLISFQAPHLPKVSNSTNTSDKVASAEGLTARNSSKHRGLTQGLSKCQSEAKPEANAESSAVQNSHGQESFPTLKSPHLAPSKTPLFGSRPHLSPTTERSRERIASLLVEKLLLGFGITTTAIGGFLSLYDFVDRSNSKQLKTNFLSIQEINQKYIPQLEPDLAKNSNFYRNYLDHADDLVDAFNNRPFQSPVFVRSVVLTSFGVGSLIAWDALQLRKKKAPAQEILRHTLMMVSFAGAAISGFSIYFHTFNHTGHQLAKLPYFNVANTVSVELERENLSLEEREKLLKLQSEVEEVLENKRAMHSKDQRMLSISEYSFYFTTILGVSLLTIPPLVRSLRRNRQEKKQKLNFNPRESSPTKIGNFRLSPQVGLKYQGLSFGFQF